MLDRRSSLLSLRTRRAPAPAVVAVTSLLQPPDARGPPPGGSGPDVSGWPAVVSANARSLEGRHRPFGHHPHQVRPERGRSVKVRVETAGVEGGAIKGGRREIRAQRLLGGGPAEGARAGAGYADAHAPAAEIGHEDPRNGIAR